MKRSNSNKSVAFVYLFICCLFFSACPGKKTDLASKEESVKQQIVAETTSTSDHCKGSEVHTMVRPAYPDKDRSKNSFFSYSFRLKKSNLPDAPTIIYLPGGPGGPSMETQTTPWMDHFNYVFTDVRGSGCNEFNAKDLPDDAIRTEYAASDIVAIIDYLKEPSKSGIHFGSYIIHGSSYGTVLATVVGSQIELSARTLPKGIVLEGTYGKARDFTKEYQESVVRGYWNEIKENFSDSVKNEVSHNPSPYGISMDVWETFVTFGLSYGSLQLQLDLSGNPEWKHMLELYLSTPPTEFQLDAIKEMTKSVLSSHHSIFRSRAYRNITCHELYSYGEGCANGTLDRPYDSAKYQLKTPLYYFQGEWDPNTLMEEANYHFDHQFHSSKTFVTFSRGGHGILQSELESVVDRIFHHIVYSPTNFEQFLNDLKNAGNPITVKVN